MGTELGLALAVADLSEQPGRQRREPRHRSRSASVGLAAVLELLV